MKVVQKMFSSEHNSETHRTASIFRDVIIQGNIWEDGDEISTATLDILHQFGVNATIFNNQVSLISKFYIMLLTLYLKKNFFFLLCKGRHVCLSQIGERTESQWPRPRLTAGNQVPYSLTK